MATKTLEEYYINNNPGNIKVSKGWAGDFYIGLKGGKYKKFDTKAMGLANIIHTMKNYMETDIDKIIGIYAQSDESGDVNPNYSEELKKHYNVLQNIDFDNDEQLINIMKGVTTLENPSDGKYSADKYYKDTDYIDAIKLYRESKLFEGQGTIDEQIKDAEMQGLNLQ